MQAMYGSLGLCRPCRMYTGCRGNKEGAQRGYDGYLDV